MYLFLKSQLAAALRSPLVQKALHTFWQSAMAVFVVGIPAVASILKIQGVNAGQAALVSLLTAAFAAGLSAIKTLLVAKG